MPPEVTETSTPVEPCTASWVCSDNFKVKIECDGTESQREYCPGDCSNGRCCNACADFGGSCGSFDNGCGGAISCNCGSGENCVMGKCSCAPKTCTQLKFECGSSNDGCGGTISCGECEKGFACLSGHCMLKILPGELEISNVRAFPYSTHVVITWQTTIDADSTVEYGETEQLGQSKFDGKPASEHSLPLYSLKPETKYFFRVVSSVGEGEPKKSDTLSFQTKYGDEGLNVLLIQVTPESKVLPEGQSFSFKAITNALNPAGLEFYWDFGDDSNAGGERAFHSFYGIGLAKEKEFVVKVKVKDSNGQTAGAEVKVKVLKAAFKARVLEPVQSKMHSKEKDLNVRLEFFDDKDAKIDCGKVGVKALLAGTVVELQCNGSVFEGVFRPWASLGEMELLEIMADYEAKGKKQYFKTRVPVYFEPSLVDATDVFKGKKYFFSDYLDTANVRFLLNDIFLVFPTEIKAFLVSGEKEKEVKVEKQEYDYVLYLDHTVDEIDLLQGLSLKLKGRDAIGHRVEDVQVVPIVKKNPALVIAVLEPLEGERAYSFGQIVSLKAKILSDNYRVQGKKMLLECLGLDLVEEL
ncbi:MAG: fibronectin type III domain-containing protein, partial [Candidatus Diapherotrites archaeon]